MKKIFYLAAAFLMAAAFNLPSFAQEEGSGQQGEQAAAAPDKPAAKPAPKKPAKKAKTKAKAKPKKKKKKPAKPTSEYKFQAVETVPSYKFDKEANPIVKKKKKKTKTVKGKKSAPPAKLKPAKPIGEEDQPQQPPQDQPQGQGGQ